jgi:hypothetical protein
VDVAAVSDWPVDWRILVEREVRSHRFVVAGIGIERAQEACFAQDDHVVETFSPDRANEAFDITVLPVRSRRDGMISDAHRPNTALKHLAERFIIVANEDRWRTVPRKSIRDLTGQSLGSWVFGDGDPNDLAPQMFQDHESIEPFEPIVGAVRRSTDNMPPR